jgi:hypothetical protein
MHRPVGSWCWEVVDSDPPALFSPGWIAFLNFLLVGLKLGRKKVRGEKKVEKQVAQKGSDLPTTQSPYPLTLTRSMTDVFLSNCVNNSIIVYP